MNKGEEVARAVLDELEDRRGIRQQLLMVQNDDPDIYEEIKQAIGRAAIEAMPRLTPMMIQAGVDAAYAAGLDGPHGIGQSEIETIMLAVTSAALAG